MCRSIKTLRGDAGAGPDDSHAAALQYVRKISGYRMPSERNREAFDSAVAEVTQATERLLARLPSAGPQSRSSRPVAARPAGYRR